jgi:hypothetical protein
MKTRITLMMLVVLSFFVFVEKSFAPGPEPEIEASPDVFDFYATEGGNNPPDQTLTIRNSGTSRLDWEITEDCTWLSVEPTSGTSFGEDNLVTVSVDITGLSEDTYYCELTISDPDASNNPQTVQVNLHINGMTTYYVDDDGGQNYTNIQDAIDAASDGYEIVVYKGVYDSIDFKDKTITVRSTDPDDWGVVEETVINGGGSNRAVVFGGDETGDCLLQGFTITNGDTVDGGGGVFGAHTNANIDRCIVEGNVAGSTGGGIQVLQGTISNCIIRNNTASHGGGIAGCSGDIINCLIADNSASYNAGGLNNCSGSIINCTVVYNVATEGNGGGFRWGVDSDPDPQITNCIVWGNTDSQGSGESSQIYPGEEDNPIVAYCCVQNRSNTDDGNIIGYPYFADVSPTDPLEEPDYHLTWNSPCINSGDPDFAGEAQVDIDGEERVIDGRVDMGVDEFDNRPVNLVKNPGFEDVESNFPVNWEDDAGSDGTKSVDSTPQNVHTGSNSWKFVNPENEYNCYAYSDFIKVDNDKNNIFFYWCKGNAGQEIIRIDILQYKSDQTFLKKTENGIWRRCNKCWTGYYWNLTNLEEDTGYIKVELANRSDNSTVWWDDIEVLEMTWGLECLPAYGCDYTTDIARTVDFGEFGVNESYVDGGVQGYGYGIDNGVTYRALASGNTMVINFPAFNTDAGDFPLTPMLLEIMYRDDGTDDEVFVSSLGLPLSDYILSRLGGEDDDRWKYMQYGFQKSNYQLLKAVFVDPENAFKIQIENNNSYDLPIDYVSLRKITEEEYTALFNKQREARGFYEAELPADESTGPPIPKYSDLTLFSRDIMRPVYRHTKPKKEEIISDPIEAFSCWGEVEPISFSIYSKDGIENVSVEVLALNGPDSSSIPAENISVYRVIYDETRLMYWSRYNNSYALYPDRLEEFDTLSIKAGTSERIWIKVEVPDESPSLTAGTYTGTITINGVAEPPEIDINLEIYDITLDNSAHNNNQWDSPQWFSTQYSINEDYAEEIICEAGFDLWADVPIEINDVTGELDSENFNTRINAIKTNGYSRDYILVFIPPERWKIIYNIETGRDYDVDKNLSNFYELLSNEDFEAAMENYIMEHITPTTENPHGLDVAFFVIDEPGDDPYRRILSERLYTIIKGCEGGKTWTNYYDICDESCDPGGYDTPEDYNGPGDSDIPPLTNLVDYKCWRARDIGIGYNRHNGIDPGYPNYYGEFGYYTTYHSHMPDPVYNRFLHGLFPFATDAKIVESYKMASVYTDPYNDFDAHYDYVFPFTYPDYLLVYPTWTGDVVYSIGGLEGVREGVKDAKYIATLERLITENPSDPDTPIAEAYLDALKSRISKYYKTGYYDETTELGYHEAIIEEISDTSDENDPQDYESFTYIRKKIADFIEDIQ